MQILQRLPNFEARLLVLIGILSGYGNGTNSIFSREYGLAQQISIAGDWPGGSAGFAVEIIPTEVTGEDVGSAMIFDPVIDEVRVRLAEEGRGG